MAHTTLSITDPNGTIWTSELCPELYALLAADAHRMDTPVQTGSTDLSADNGMTLSDCAVTVLSRALLRQLSDSESEHTGGLLEDALHLLWHIRDHATIGVRMTRAIGRILDQAAVAGIDLLSEDAPPALALSRWHVSGVVSYSLTGALLSDNAIVDINVVAADWYAAETAALTKLFSALEVDPDIPFDYTWAAGPDVTLVE